MKKKMTAVEWSGTGLKWVRAEKSNGSWNVVQTIFAASIQEFIEKNGLRKEAVLLSLPRREFFFHWVKCAPGELEKTAEQEFPLPLSSLAWSAVPIRRDKGGYLLAGISKARLHQYTNALEEARISVEGVGINLLAQLQTRRREISKNFGEKPFLLVDIGATETQLTLAKATDPLMCHSLALGGNNLTRRLQTFLGVSWEEAEKIKGEGTAVPHEIIDAWTQEFADGIKRTVETLRRNKILIDTPPLCLTGGGSALKGLPETLSAVLRVSIERASPNEASTAGAVGLILSVDEQETLWIVPAFTRSRWREKWNKHRSTVLACLSVVFVACSMSLSEIKERENIKLGRLVKELHEIRSSHASASTQSSCPDSFIDIFLEVARHLPTRAHFIDYNYDAAQKTFAIRGRSADYALVSSFVSEVSQNPQFKRVNGRKASLANIGGQSVVEFSVEGNLR